MTQELHANTQDRAFLTLEKARGLAGKGFAGTWYIAPVSSQWTIGLLSADDQRRYHVLDEAGEPLRFEYAWDAWEYLRREVRVPAWKLPPSPREQLGRSMAAYPSLVHGLLDRGARKTSPDKRK